MAEKLIGVTELAEILGTTTHAVVMATRSGRITAASDGKNGKLYDAELAAEQWTTTATMAEMQDGARFLPKELRGRKRATGEVLPGEELSDSAMFLRAKAAKEAVNARLAELRLKERSGEFMPKKEARERTAELGAILLGFIQAFPDRHADKLAAMTDRHDVWLYLRDELDNVIVQIRARCGANDKEDA